MCDILLSQWAKVFEVMYGKAIRACRIQDAAILDGLRNNVGEEGGHQIFKQTLFEEPTLDIPAGRITVVGDGLG